MRPDTRKSLEKFNEEWADCQACSLGKRRHAEGQAFVAGEGTPGSVMFIGEGPGWQEEQEGRPFVGKSGGLLRGILQKLNMQDVYISNVVPCRSCGPVIDGAGQTAMRFDRRLKMHVPRVTDKVPPPEAVTACRPRLQEEIYLVDPVLIVTLGVPAAEALLARSVKITKERGEPTHVTIPGNRFVPELTEKGKWARKVKGEWRQPSAPRQVRYLVLPTLHPAFVLRRLQDQGERSEAQSFLKDLRLAKAIRDRLLLEMRGDTMPVEPEPIVSDDELMNFQSNLLDPDEQQE